ncbi:MAG TPA: hypothetical protein HA283_04575 [Nanoarchaeota archaeon]|nr:hypothetical protein [Nanoarchaeota archaeon]HIH63543.1 hypothetical protein [Nanoarchaeota archaeon]HIJ09471.1 hypothetical protein [Nanoarchaeota archaeon]
MIEDKNKVVEIAVIAGAAHALEYKKKNPRASDEEAIQHVNKECKNILRRLDY